EEYRGLAILTSNRRDDLDPAFLRRIRFFVEFPAPDAALREALWRRMFPPGVPVANLDFFSLRALDQPGGSIRNIALHAVFHAAAAGTAVTMEHVHRAALQEYEKLERLPVDVRRVFG